MRSNQRVFDEQFASARCFLAESAYAAHPLPLEIFELAMVLEKHKEVMQLCQRIKN